LENREDLNPQRPAPHTPPTTADPTSSNGPDTPAANGPGTPKAFDTSTRPGRPPAPRPAEVPADEEDAYEDPLTLRTWLIANSIPLAVVAALIGAVFYFFNWDGRLAIFLAFVGLSFVVFVHEMGHFLVAKWCDVEVTTFSIGFGPAVPGCSWQWGETTYKLSLIPIGGYVQMVGQVDGDEASDGSEDNPRSYRNKSVGQRMAIISAGVIMNVILAMVIFVAVYQGPGKERHAAVVGRVDTAMPAFKYGIRSSAAIEQVGDVTDPSFEDLIVVVMRSMHGEQVKFISTLPDGQTQVLDIEPRLDKNDKKPMIGLAYPSRPDLITRRGLDPEVQGPYRAETAAARAQPPLEFGDRIVAMSDPDAPNHAVTPLPDDPRFPGHGRHDYFDFERRLKLLAGEPVVLRVERKKQEKTETVDCTVPPMYGLSLGVRMQMGPITAIRLRSPADNADLKVRDITSGREGDLIEAIEVTEADKSIKRFDDKADPFRLPYELKQWAQRLVDAEKRGDITAAQRKELSQVKLTVRRHRAGGGPQFATETITVPWDDSWRFEETGPMSIGAPLAIPELGLAYQIKTIVAAVQPGTAGESPLKPGDVIKNYRFTYVDFNGKDETSRWLKNELEEGDWARIATHLLRSTMAIRSIEFEIERDKKTETVTVVPTHDQSWPLDERGWLLLDDTRRQKADHFYDAIAMGMRDTWNGIMQVFQNLRGMATGRVSIDNLGGPVMIANIAYRIAGYDFWELVFFLGMISVNLAVVNFLPIPVLDGGHMVFLIYEKLRGRPASEPVRVGATYAGLAMILSLFVFVFWNDIRRFFL
jgi:regulator of sigma E protease